MILSRRNIVAVVNEIDANANLREATLYVRVDHREFASIFASPAPPLSVSLSLSLISLSVSLSLARFPISLSLSLPLHRCAGISIADCRKVRYS